MAVKVPSSLIDNERIGKMADPDRYYGDVPMYLIAIPESKIYECNMEYVGLVEAMVRGELRKENVSPDLWKELEYVIDNSSCYGTVPMPTLDPLYACMNITSGTLEPVVLVKRPLGGYSTLFVDRGYGRHAPFVIKV